MTRWLKRSLVAGLTISAALVTPALAQNVIKEGEGQRRRTLDATELKPFTVKHFDTLKDWANGTAPTAGDIDGKVVLICCYVDWYPPAAKALGVAKRMAEKYGKDGLIVVAVHGQQGWKDAKKPKAESEGASLLLAHDEKGEFRTAIKADQDPDFFVVDRAGQMRFADIATESVDSAVDFLIKEKKDQAAGRTGTLAAEAKTREAERRRSEAIRTQVDMTAIPEVPFKMPLPEAYAKDKVKWPHIERPEGSPPEDPRNPEPPIVVTLPDTGYFPEKPKFAGRAVLLYFWHPDLPATYRLFEPMDTLQRQNSRDLIVIGVMSPLKITTQGGGGQTDYKFEDDPAKLKEKIESIAARQRIGHTLLLDMEGSIINTAKGKETEIIIPWGAVMSSDNAVRWAGFLGKPTFKGSLDKVLEVDPGINARRAAEDEFLRTRLK